MATSADYKGSDLEHKCLTTIRMVSADQPEAAKSGHPGAPMGCAPLAYLLWAEVMKYSAKDPNWMGRDRFVLSNGHACALQYTMLHLTGYPLTKEDLGQFRQLESKTPGHPECFLTDGTYFLFYDVVVVATNANPSRWSSNPSSGCTYTFGIRYVFVRMSSVFGIFVVT